MMLPSRDGLTRRDWTRLSLPGRSVSQRPDFRQMATVTGGAMLTSPWPALADSPSPSTGDAPCPEDHSRHVFDFLEPDL